MAPILRVQRVTKYFAGLAALQEVSLDVAEGQICGLIGPNGAGKTTLFSIIAGSLRPTSGTVTFQGIDTTRLTSFEAVRAGIARTHQITRPFRSMTACENVEVAIHFGRGRRAGSARQEARAILEWVGMGHAGGVPASALCVGDQKRLELARTLAARPKLLLCDEVCSGLTETEMGAVLRLLLRIREEGTTILYVEHNLRAIMSVCDQIVVLNSGQKLAEGPPRVIQNDPAVIEAYIGKSPIA